MEDRPSVPICIEAPEHVRRVVVYAAEELLRDLEVQPRFVQRDELGKKGIYYGSEPEAVAEDVFCVWCTSDVEEVLRTPHRISGEEAWWLGSRFDWEGTITHVKDPLATAFVWLSGWHEEAVVARDAHGRVRFADSLAVTNPVRTPVDDIRHGLARVLAGQGIPVAPRTWGNGSSWAVALTHDVDALPHDLLGTAARMVTSGVAVNRARKRSIDALLDLENRLELSATWFLKTARRSKEDARIDLGSKHGARLVQRLKNAGHEIGVHPTYFAADHPEYIAEEKRRFERVVGASPTTIRTHYLRWLPATQSILDGQGLKVDSTVGFAESEGFRRGTCHPFRLYDCRRHEATNLVEMPLAAMDTSFVEYQALSVDEMRERIRAVFDAARKANGVVVVLWHPAVHIDPDWDDRLNVLAACLLEARETGAFVGALDELL